MTLAKRIKAAREHAGLTQIELSRKVGLPQQVISKLENDLQQETAALIKIAVACGVDPVWLDSGQGNMLSYGRDAKIQAVVSAMENLPEYKKDILVQTSNALAEQQSAQKNNGTK